MSEDQHPESVTFARAFLEAWAAGDQQTVGSSIDDDIVFVGPMAEARGRDAYLAATGAFAEMVTGVRIIAALGDGDQALLMYDMDTVPFGTIRAAELFVLRHGYIVADHLVFDTYPVRQAQAA